MSSSVKRLPCYSFLMLYKSNHWLLMELLFSILWTWCWFFPYEHGKIINKKTRLLHQYHTEFISKYQIISHYILFSLIHNLAHLKITGNLSEVGLRHQKITQHLCLWRLGRVLWLRDVWRSNWQKIQLHLEISY